MQILPLDGGWWLIYHNSLCVCVNSKQAARRLFDHWIEHGKLNPSVTHLYIKTRSDVLPPQEV